MKDSANSSNKKTKKFSKKAFKGGEFSRIDVNDKFAHIEAVQAQPLEVKVINNNFDKALRAFRALVQKERVLSNYKERQEYEKPSDRRRRKKNEAKRKSQENTTGRSGRPGNERNERKRAPKAPRPISFPQQ